MDVKDPYWEELLWTRGRHRHWKTDASYDHDRFAALPVGEDRAYALWREQVVPYHSSTRDLVLSVEASGPWGRKAQRLLTLAYPLAEILKDLPADRGALQGVDRFLQ